MVQLDLTHGEAQRLMRAVRVPAPKSMTNRILSSMLLVLYALMLALGIGLGSAYWMVSRGYSLASNQAGPWTVWSRISSRDADPYARAIVNRTGDIPLAVGEGLLLTASADSEGRSLDPRCTYRIGMTTPQARLWTLSLYGADDRPVVTDLMRSGFTSAEIVRDDRSSIILSRDARPGNWLRMPVSGRVSLALRLYDTSVAIGSATLEASALPSIERLECAP